LPFLVIVRLTGVALFAAWFSVIGATLDGQCGGFFLLSSSLALRSVALTFRITHLAFIS
jgi:hypothetical protein